MELACVYMSSFIPKNCKKKISKMANRTCLRLYVTFSLSKRPKWTSKTLNRTHLRLNVVSRDYIPHGPERRRHDALVGVHEQLHQPPADARIDDGLDLLVGPVREVGQGPAGVGQHVGVAVEQQFGQNLEEKKHTLKRGESLDKGL